MLIVLSSATSAERMKKLLAEKKISAEVVQTPKSISEGGCGYSVRVNDRYKDEALTAAKSLKIAVKSVYDELGGKKDLSYRRKE